MLYFTCSLHIYSYYIYHYNIQCQVHGGTTEEDIILKVKKAEELAKKNRMRAQVKEGKVNIIDTVLFFDEANTTEAIGLIKEVMCDRRMNGEKISEDVKFVAACNPYRK